MAKPRRVRTGKMDVLPRDSRKRPSAVERRARGDGLRVGTDTLPTLSARAAGTRSSVGLKVLVLRNVLRVVLEPEPHAAMTLHGHSVRPMCSTRRPPFAY